MNYYEHKQRSAERGWVTRRRNAKATKEEALHAAREEGMRLAAEWIAEWLTDNVEIIHELTTGVVYCEQLARNRLRAQLAGEVRLGAYRKGD